MHRRLGAPLGGYQPDGAVDVLVKTQQVADDAAVQQGAVGVGVGQVGRLEFFAAELVKDGGGVGFADDTGFRRSRAPRALLALGSVRCGISGSRASRRKVVTLRALTLCYELPTV